jgi:hypothetical protein
MPNGSPGGTTEGVAYFDHPSNPGHPAHWHVREDGWMGAAPCFEGPLETSRERPLTLRYLLHAHRGGLDQAKTRRLAAEFAAAPAFEVVKAEAKHVQSAIRRKKGV